jgi:type II secretory pathway predicted ATPase ExeA
MSADFDSRALLTVVLAGDGRLGEMFRSVELLPLASRIRVRLTMEPETPARLAECVRHALDAAGAPKLMTDELITTLAEHAAGNTRLLMTLGCDLLAEGAKRELPKLDEKLYFELYAPPPTLRAKAPAASARR